MHGALLRELQRFGEHSLGVVAWARITAEACLGDRVYLHTADYPDDDLPTLITCASRTTGRTADALLQDFGAFLAPSLLRTYAPLVRPQWRTLEIIENTEETIHTVVRLRNPGAHPPALKVTRTGPDAVLVVYASSRRLCALAKGIMRGIADSFGDAITISERACMLRGDPQCELEVSRLPASADEPRP
jgi:hypothetical protein